MGGDKKLESEFRKRMTVMFRISKKEDKGFQIMGFNVNSELIRFWRFWENPHFFLFF